MCTTRFHCYLLCCVDIYSCQMCSVASELSLRNLYTLQIVTSRVLLHWHSSRRGRHRLCEVLKCEALTAVLVCALAFRAATHVYDKASEERTASIFGPHDRSSMSSNIGSLSGCKSTRRYCADQHQQVTYCLSVSQVRVKLLNANTNFNGEHELLEKKRHVKIYSSVAWQDDVTACL